MNRKVLGVCMLLGFAVGVDATVAQTIHPQWSVANGSIILYSRDGNAADLLILDPDSGEMQALLSDGKFNANPSWSPDAKKVSLVIRALTMATRSSSSHPSGDDMISFG